MEKILIKYHDYEIPHIEKIKIGDWIDLRAAEEVMLREGDSALISLGIAMKLPDGYEAHVLPRSSTFKNFGIIMANSMGVIDNSYSGTNDIWRFPAYCLQAKATGDIIGKKPVSIIKKGDRICQFRIMKKQPEVEFDEVLVLDEVDRKGFGSTGTR